MKKILLKKQHNVGRKGGEPDAIVVHWSAGSGDEIKLGQYFERNPGKDASYHRGIGRAGGVAEYVDTANTAWHAGDGEPWDGGRKINARSVGICLCLHGPVDSGWAKQYPARTMSAPHRKRGVRATLWERPTPEQIASLRAMIAELKAKHPSIRYLVGHDDVTRGKIDPGPILDGADLGLAALGIVRIVRRWDTAGAPWEGLDAPAAPTPEPDPATPQEPAQEADEPSPAEPAEPEPEPAKPAPAKPTPAPAPTKAERKAAAKAAKDKARADKASEPAQVAVEPGDSAHGDHGIPEDQEAAARPVE